MANEKTLMTRIVNKHAELSTWNSSTLALKEGEIALAKVLVDQPDGTKAPTFIAKIGNGDTFANSPYLFAKASDVYSWAKAATKPTYTANEISLTSGSKVEEEILSLKNALGTETNISEAIKKAIDAIDNDDAAVDKQFVTAAVQTDGKVVVTRRALVADDIPTLEIAKINGLQAALDAKATEASVTERFTTVNTRLDSGDIKEAIEAAKKAGDDAQDYIEAYETANDARVKAIEDDYTTAAEAGTIAEGKVSAFNTATVAPLAERVTTVESNLSALAGEGNTSTVKANADAIAKLAQDIGNVANVMNFRGVSRAETVGADITDPKAGDVIIYGDAEYVYDETGAWVKFGDASDNATAITGLGEKVTAIESSLADTGTIGAKIIAAQDAADDALDAIDVINGTGEGSIAKAVADAVESLEDYADQAETDAITAANAYTDGEIQKVEEKVTTAQNAIDTHAALQNNPHKVTAEQVGLGKVENKTVAEIKTEITGTVADGSEGFVTGDAVYDAVEAAKAAAATDATNKVNTLGESVTANATAITNINNNYARVSADNKLVYGQGDAEMVIIFDCGGAE